MVEERYDTIVVGAGSSGCPLAYRLSERGRRVLLIEAGRDYGPLENYPDSLRLSHTFAINLPGDPHSWSYMGELTPQVRYPITRGRVLGGSSAVNGGQFFRGTPADYDGWAAAGAADWAYDSVLPFLVRIETDLDFPHVPWHGADGPIRVVRSPVSTFSPVAAAFSEAAVERAHAWVDDLNAPVSSGVGAIPHNIVDGTRQNAAASYLSPDRRPPTLNVLDRTVITRILFEGSRAVGVTGTRDGKAVRFYGEEIVLSAGALNSPHILLLSGIGPADELRRFGVDVVHDMPGVGGNLMDHPSVSVNYRVRAAMPAFAPGNVIGQVVLNLSTPGSSSTDDLRIFPYNYPKSEMFLGSRNRGLSELLQGVSLLRRPLATLGGFRGMSKRAFVQDVQHRADLALHCALACEDSRGRIRLKSADPSVPVRLDYGYLTESRDRERFRYCVRLARELLWADSFRALGVESTGLTDAEAESDGELDRWLKTHMGTSSHTAGTCRMGRESDPEAVVDGTCRVIGVENLRVVDVSIMPSLVRRGPNASALMIGERASEFFA